MPNTIQMLTTITFEHPLSPTDRDTITTRLREHLELIALDENEFSPDCNVAEDIETNTYDP